MSAHPNVSSKITCFCCHQYDWEMCKHLLKNIKWFHPNIQASSYTCNVIIQHIAETLWYMWRTYIWTYLWLSYSYQTKQMSSSPRPPVWEMNVCRSSFQSAINTRKQQFSHLFNKSTEGFTTLLLLLNKPSFCLPNSHNPAFIGCRTTHRWDCLSQVFADDVLWFPLSGFAGVSVFGVWQAQTRGRLTVHEQVGLSERGRSFCSSLWGEMSSTCSKLSELYVCSGLCCSCCVYKVGGDCICLYMANDYRNDFLLTE